MYLLSWIVVGLVAGWLVGKSGLGGLETFLGSALCDCLRPVPTYPGERASIPGPRTSR